MLIGQWEGKSNNVKDPYLIRFVKHFEVMNMLEIGVMMVAINFALGIILIWISMYAKKQFTPAWKLPWLIIASSSVVLVGLTGILPALYIDYRGALYSLFLPSSIIVADRVVLVLVTLLLARAAYKSWGKRFSRGFFMIDESTFGSIRSRLTKIYGESPTKVLMYAIGRESGARSGSLVGKRKAKSGKDFLKEVFAAQNEVGWGHFEIASYKEDEEVTVLVRECFESKAGDEFKHRCDFVRGFLAGAASLIAADGETETVETKCVSFGDPHCEFVTRFTQMTELSLPDVD